MQKRFLLASAASAAVLAMSISGASAEVAVKLSGSIATEFGYVNQKADYKTVQTTTASGVANRNFKTGQGLSSKMRAAVDGKSDAGLNYGGMLELDNTSFDSTKDYGDAVRFRKSYVYLGSDAMGTVRFGMDETMSNKMKIDATKISAGDGPGTDASYFMNSQVGSGYYVVGPNLYTDSSSTMRKYHKVSYVTPSVAGFQFGIDYGVNNEDRGGLGNLFAKSYSASTGATVDNRYNNMFTAGLTYNYAADNLTVQLGSTGMYGKAKKQVGASALTDKYRDLRAYQVGTVITYTNFSVAGSYGDSGKSGNNKDTTDALAKAKQSFYTVGASYQQGPVVISLTDINSKYRKNKFNNYQLGTSYKVAPGMVTFIEGSKFKFKPQTAVAKNSGSVILIGAKLAF